MGWYTEGSTGFEYKYGDVVGLALESKLGTLTATPRLMALDESGDPLDLDELEFIGPLQRRIKELGLPWKPELEYSGPGGEDLPVALDADPTELVGDFVRAVQDNRLSIEQVIAKSIRRAPPVAELVVSAEFDWTLPASEFPRLVAWINAGVPSDVVKLSIEGLRQGKLNAHDWYEPPEALAPAFDALADDDESPRHMAAHALAHAVLADLSELYLGQPDDDYQVTAWPEDDDDDDAGEDEDEDDGDDE